MTISHIDKNGATLASIMDQHSTWVESVGWHNTTALEAAGMVLSEVGELTNECRNESLSNDFGLESADSILRILDMISISDSAIDEPFSGIRRQMPRGIDINSSGFGYCMSEYSEWTGAEKGKGMSLLARTARIGGMVGELISMIDDDTETLPNTSITKSIVAKVILSTSALAVSEGFEIGQFLERKMAINIQRGARKRIK